MKASACAAQKYLLRIDLRRKLKALSLNEIKRRSFAVEKKILQSREFKSARTVLIYASLPSEIQTFGLIRGALTQGKRVLLPRFKKNGSSLEMVAIRSLAGDLKKGPFGIWEPSSRLKPYRGALDLAIVPGLGFDRNGNRLGRGLGCFDRFLEGIRGVSIAGLAFKEQILKSIPVEKHDVPVSQVWIG